MKIKIISFLAVLTVFFFPFGVLAEECVGDNLRWANSSNRLYISGGAVCNLTQIKEFASKYTPLTLVDQANKIWLLETNIHIQDGSVLLLEGGPEGDVNELRLKSDEESYVYIKADWGNVNIENTKVISWDKNIQAPDLNFEDGRAFISVKSRLESGESRMDINSSDVGHLGHYAPEAYGLSWKVLGTGEDIYDRVGVYGDVIDSKIHNNFFGIYTFGGEAMNFKGNEIYGNEWYGLDPHDDSDNLVIDSNSVYENGRHGIICSQRCDNVIISNNNSSNNGGSGIMLHRYVVDSIVENNITNNNADSGIVLFEANKNKVSSNVANYNNRGIRISVGSSSNYIANNDFSNNIESGIFSYKGTDVPTSGDGRIKHNAIKNNIINSNGVYGIKLKGADYNLLEKNQINNSGKEGVKMLDSNQNKLYENIISNSGRDGFNFKNSNFNFAADNTVSNSGRYSLYLDNSMGNLFINNQFSETLKSYIEPGNIVI